MRAPLTARQLEMRRRRNREAMRRGRERKQAELSGLRGTIEALEARLATLELRREAATGATGGGRGIDPEAELARLRAEREALGRRLDEQQAFHGEVEELLGSREDCGEDTRQPELAERRDGLQTDGAIATDDGGEFAWVQRVLPLLPELTAVAVAAMARESYLDTVKYMRLAEASSAGSAANNVLGWQDQRSVEAGMATFLFSKSFPHEDTEPLVAKTWQVLTLGDQTNGFQVRDLHLRVIQRLNDDALIMARNIYFPRESRFYSALYVLTRVKTVDGYIISGRTILPLIECEAELSQAMGQDRSYVSFHYGMSFASITTLDENGRVVGSGGCNVRYGGRFGPCSSAFAHSWTMDVLLAVLRWESNCVGPLYRLTAG